MNENFNTNETDNKVIDFINYHAASYVNEFMNGDSITRARMQEILTSFGKQLLDCYPCDVKETLYESSNCIKPDVSKRHLIKLLKIWKASIPNTILMS